ncbi:hypothetical protein ABB37_03309 [Leptomonas pyrrhocoris]|uniref:F-box domain-containing protein n=1 Tax=Leptomonas pyrrhocoris TaxID=157538 RepID=A0A0N0DWT1_LEPPY|nr:hypothetical protein ABB37_03309 [Leptomonas pyrrhocoris]XP_015660625.1 hypothetical protein ABB37_03309 [Leptomonas pyrrhocoris]XP_015660626.1 hypothetical protein ABB37_03309 [Leptomonas pyrrhocoris]KPA82185.1 hypothetical protein ABB37_03309 [Leptomonas pyrrhocoris]KPA82186.1 hypothetical protein ABB37_03309 [Leptomonas pyrrhocoris]KPA82187.1 hypothetical protein ABB37_03309 [Leptomonas pyrrhocoris]|eukprot:XP_015660624.1 hypothetical protein ABB37_03309 [Leptomonas pyrrhocoris]
MNENTTSPASPSDKTTPPLRSTTVLRSSTANGAAAGGSNAGFASIRLNTYHDSSDLKAALRELGAAFAGLDDDAATSSAPADSPSPAVFSRTKPIRKNDSSSRATSSAHQNAVSSTNQAKVTVDASPKAAAALSSVSSPLPPSRRRTGGGPSRFLQLPPQLMLRCFAFCDLKALGVLCRVSVRMNVIVEQQGHTLWADAALRRRIPIANVSVSRDELRRAVEQQAHARHAEEEFYEKEIARMEERLRVRAEDVYAQNVDVDRTIATGGAQTAATDASGATLPYWLKQQRTMECGRGDGVAEGSFAAAKGSTSAQLCAKLRTEIEALEETKRLCECKLGLQEDSLRQQEAQLQQWQAFLSPGAVGGAATLRPANGSLEETAASPLINAAQLAQFERRVARLVLNGSITTAITTGAGASAGDDENVGGIPFVFRRGVEDFATLELVLRAMETCASVESAAPSVEGSHPAPSAVARDAGKRWRAFQQVCPVNEEYGNVRCYLRSQELRAAVPSTTSNLQPSGDSGGRPSAKQTPALLRVSGFVRRVEAMTDGQVVQSWM